MRAIPRQPTQQENYSLHLTRASSEQMEVYMDIDKLLGQAH